MRNAALALLASVPPLAAQMGDKPGEPQTGLPADLAVPPAPALSAEEELATFAVPPGFRVELVAAEPLVHDPVQAFFDWDGRLWVCEMRGFMPDVDGVGEDAPVGSIAVLTDVDGDGRMDERSVFLDQLVLPRAIAPYEDGLLCILPPELVFVRDTDGDGRGDEREVVDTGFGGIFSPEHAANGLVRGVDGWVELANHSLRYKRLNDRWESQPTAGGGQWGIAKDDLGRRFYDTNSDALRGDLISSHYAVRNPHQGTIWGVNLRFARDQTVWPARINPGVNRGYRKGTLRDDFTLAKFTGACGPHVFRGDALPAEYRGDAFVCEPCGNLVKRFELVEDEEGVIRAENAWEGREFLTSTDERFRPVNLMDGPDGALYVVDLYRGMIQHRIFVTSFLREQVLARGLEEPTGLGRIWRVVHEEIEARGTPDLAEARSSDLVALLDHPNGWMRDLCQRLLVEEGAPRYAVEQLRGKTMVGEDPLARMHAVWTLSERGWLKREELRAALRDDDWRVRHAAVRASEPLLAAGGADSEWLVARWLERYQSEDPRVKRQMRLSLGEGHTPFTDEALAAVFTEDAGDGRARQDVLSGLHERELAFLELLLGNAVWEERRDGYDATLKLLARAIAREGRSDKLERLLELVATDPVAWRRTALAKGVLDGRPPGPDGKPYYLPIAVRPASFDALAGTGIEDWLLWPGRDDVDVIPVRPLTDSEQARFAAGSVVFAEICSQCHQRSGLGEPGKAPPLRYSEWVLGSDDRLIRIVTGGLTGALTVRGQSWSGDMPAYAGTDEELASVLTYLRREWGHGAEPVTPARVAAVRAATSRAEPWTQAALEAEPEVPRAAGGGEPRSHLLSEDGAWCWFGDPRATVDAEGRLLAGWITSAGDVQLGRFDLASGDREVATVRAALESDDHDNPSVLPQSDGRILVQYSRHGGDAILQRTTAQPGDLAVWTDERVLTLNPPATGRFAGARGSYTYPNLVALPAEGGRVHLFWRGLHWKPCWSTSDDGGETWSDARVVLSAPEAGGGNRPYVKVRGARDGARIHLAFTDGHPRNEPENAIRYAVYGEGAWRRAGGGLVAASAALPFDPAAADVVYDGGAGRAWIWDVADDEHGRPVIAYARCPEEADHRLHWARWDGARWLDVELCAAGGWFPDTPAGEREPEPHYSGGIALDPADPSTVVLAREVDGAFELERWRTDDGGTTWESETLTRSPGVDDVRPTFARGRGAGEPPVVLWMANTGGYRHYTDFDTELRGLVLDPVLVGPKERSGR